MTHTTCKITLIAALALLAGACVMNMEDGALVAPAGDRLVTLALSVPGPPASRGMDDTRENAVNTVDVLLFTGNADEFFYYRAIGSKPDDDGAIYKKKFEVRLPEGKWNVVILANARDAIANSSHLSLLAPATPAKNNTTVTRVDVLNSLVLQTGSDEWETDGIPMWGYHDGLVINDTPPSIPVISLTRAIARVNVSVSGETVKGKIATDYFYMTGIYLYNYSRAGSIAPTATPAGYATGEWDATELKAKAPNLPDPLAQLTDKITKLKVLGPLPYTVDDGDKHDFSRKIYTYEAAPGSMQDDELTGNTCLVIGGYYKEDPLDAVTPAIHGYYRVDFLDDQKTPLALLRNHSYNVVIQSVSGEGFPTKEGAFNNKPVNITAEIIDWDDSAIGDVKFKGEEYIGVAPTEFLLQGAARNGNRVIVKSSLPWTLSATDSPAKGGDPADWITNLSGSFTTAGARDEITFSVIKNETGVDRVAYLHVNAGGMLDFVVKITQRYISDALVWITDAGGENPLGELFFSASHGDQPAPLRFLLNWYPPTNAVEASIEPGGTFAYDAGHDAPGSVMTTITDPTSLGQRVLTVRPAPLDPQADPVSDQLSTVKFKVSNLNVDDETTILLRYRNYHTLPLVDAAYMLDGETHAFHVRSNSSWIITSVSANEILEDDPLLLGHEGGGDTTPEGEPVMFRLKLGDADLRSGQVTLTLHDPTERVPDATIVIKGVTCGTDGVPVHQQIGNRLYLTHEYGDKCWMVENSREGVYSSVGFGLDENGERIGGFQSTEFTSGDYGYYYTYTNAPSACPAGWRLPTNAEINSLITALGGNGVTDSNKWWRMESEGAFAGTYNMAQWWYGGKTGYWWYASGSNVYYYLMESNFSFTIGNSIDAGHWYSVRCVKD
jgi:uncharacterized protein (TIGR02145 family)